VGEPGVPLAAVLGAQLALARVAVSPLGVGRRVRGAPLRAWRLLPLLLAVPLFGAVVLGGIEGGGPLLLGGSFVLVLGSLLLAGPWLTRAPLAAADPGACAPGRALVAPGAAGPWVVADADGDAVELTAGTVVALAPVGFDRPAMIVAPADLALTDGAYPALALLTADPDAVERARTALSAAGVPVTLSTAELRTAQARDDTDRLGRALVGAMIGTFVVAGCSAAVATATGLPERRRSFALLRLTGTPLGVLRRCAVLELAVPLATASVAAALLGVLTGRWIGLGGGADQPVPWADLGVPLALGVAVALALGCAALPLVSRVTSGESTRFE
jgi:hypothetical protein